MIVLAFFYNHVFFTVSPPALHKSYFRVSWISPNSDTMIITHRPQAMLANSHISMQRERRNEWSFNKKCNKINEKCSLVTHLLETKDCERIKKHSQSYFPLIQLSFCGFGSVGIIDNVVDIPMWELWKCWTKITWEAASGEETPDAAPEIYKLRKENMKINRLSQT